MHTIVSAINNTDSINLFVETSSYSTDAQPHSPKLTGLHPSIHLLVEAPSPSGLKGLAASPSWATLVCSCHLLPPAFIKMCKLL